MEDDFVPEGTFGRVCRHFCLSQLGGKSAISISGWRLGTLLNTPYNTQESSSLPNSQHRIFLPKMPEALRLRNLTFEEASKDTGKLSDYCSGLGEK